jgi:hypothetical protein
VTFISEPENLFSGELTTFVKKHDAKSKNISRRGLGFSTAIECRGKNCLAVYEEDINQACGSFSAPIPASA